MCACNHKEIDFEMERLRGVIHAMTETASEQSRVHVEMHSRIHDLNQAVLFHAEDADIHRNRSIELTDALNKVWDALTAEDKRGALTDTLWMPGENCTVFEFIDHTLNPK